MLLLSRRIGDRIVIGGGIEVVVAAIGRRSVRLAVSAPAGRQVLRGEVWDAIAQANQRAASSELPGAVTASVVPGDAGTAREVQPLHCGTNGTGASGEPDVEPLEAAT